MQHYRVNPALAAELAEFGGDTLTRCFNCGNCTAVCGLSKGDTVFPRKMIRYLQLGLEDRLIESPEPWLCYYCGTCSETCPREARAGRADDGHPPVAGQQVRLDRALQAALPLARLGGRAARRHGAARAGPVHRPRAARRQLRLLLARAPPREAFEHVRLDLFAPKEIVHYGDWALAGFLGTLLGLNALRMIFFVSAGRHRDDDPARRSGSASSRTCWSTA